MYLSVCKQYFVFIHNETKLMIRTENKLLLHQFWGQKLIPIKKHIMLTTHAGIDLEGSIGDVTPPHSEG